MSEVQTIRVRVLDKSDARHSLPFIRVNRDDYDPSIHEAVDDDAPAAPAKAAKAKRGGKKKAAAAPTASEGASAPAAESTDAAPAGKKGARRKK